MKIVGVICEYNPFHLGHAEHIRWTRQALGGDVAVVCVMSGNFVQRGDLAIYNKHARAKMALQGGADLVVELPTAYTLRSAEGFAEAGVYLLNALGICEYISFGSESGDVKKLKEAADAIASDEAQLKIKQWLKKGVSYAFAQQKAADSILKSNASAFHTPNNVLGIEYIKAIKSQGSPMQPMTMRRVGGEHDSDTGYSATAARKVLLHNFGVTQNAAFDRLAGIMPEFAMAVCNDENLAGRGPVSIKSVAAESAILSRLRQISDYSDISGSSEGLEHRFAKYAPSGATISSVLEQVKSKRYPMSRIRRMLLCAVLGIKKEDTANPPPYIKVLGMNAVGKNLLASLRKRTELQVVTKPASVHKMCDSARQLFEMEARATDLYTLAYSNEAERGGGQEWRKSPIIL